MNFKFGASSHVRLVISEFGRTLACVETQSFSVRWIKVLDNLNMVVETILNG